MDKQAWLERIGAGCLAHRRKPQRLYVDQTPGLSGKLQLTDIVDVICLVSIATARYINLGNQGLGGAYLIKGDPSTLNLSCRRGLHPTTK
jgi:hypothetical protein